MIPVFIVCGVIIYLHVQALFVRVATNYGKLFFPKMEFQVDIRSLCLQGLKKEKFQLQCLFLDFNYPWYNFINPIARDFRTNANSMGSILSLVLCKPTSGGKP